MKISVAAFVGPNNGEEPLCSQAGLMESPGSPGRPGVAVRDQGRCTCASRERRTRARCRRPACGALCPARVCVGDAAGRVFLPRRRAQRGLHLRRAPRRLRLAELTAPHTHPYLRRILCTQVAAAQLCPLHLAVVTMAGISAQPRVGRPSRPREPRCPPRAHVHYDDHDPLQVLTQPHGQVRGSVAPTVTRGWGRQQLRALGDSGVSVPCVYETGRLGLHPARLRRQRGFAHGRLHAILAVAKRNAASLLSPSHASLCQEPFEASTPLRQEEGTPPPANRTG